LQDFAACCHLPFYVLHQFRYGCRDINRLFLFRLSFFTAGDIAPLPASIPDDFYSFSLESDWEQQALQQLLAAPTTTPPASPPPMHRQKQQQQHKAAAAADEDDYYEEYEEEGQEAAGDGAAAAGDVDDAAAWDAWAEYYRSMGYR
jgi:hypothetical protein